ncbi:MAG: Na+/H+ antiporter subunit E [Chromatiales bacterium]|nr:Na+/H+ antiporter subunit E [Chromatiales bacterium]
MLLPHPLLSLMLWALWLLLANSVSPGNLVLGLVLAWLIPLFTARFWADALPVRRPLVLLKFAAVVLYDIVVANIAVARLILGPQDGLRPSFIVMPLELRNDMAIALLASTISLTPGTVSAFLSADRKNLIIHSLHTEDPDEIVRQIRQRYEAPLKEVLE